MQFPRPILSARPSVVGGGWAWRRPDTETRLPAATAGPEQAMARTRLLLQLLLPVRHQDGTARSRSEKGYEFRTGMQCQPPVCYQEMQSLRKSSCTHTRGNNDGRRRWQSDHEASRRMSPKRAYTPPFEPAFRTQSKPPSTHVPTIAKGTS